MQTLILYLGKLAKWLLPYVFEYVSAKIADYLKNRKEQQQRLESDKQVEEKQVKAGSDPGLTDQQRIEEQKHAHDAYVDHFKP
jgi:hypothetical protein